MEFGNLITQWIIKIKSCTLEYNNIGHITKEVWSGIQKLAIIRK